MAFDFGISNELAKLYERATEVLVQRIKAKESEIETTVDKSMSEFYTVPRKMRILGVGDSPDMQVSEIMDRDEPVVSRILTEREPVLAWDGYRISFTYKKNVSKAVWLIYGAMNGKSAVRAIKASLLSADTLIDISLSIFKELAPVQFVPKPGDETVMGTPLSFTGLSLGLNGLVGGSYKPGENIEIGKPAFVSIYPTSIETIQPETIKDDSGKIIAAQIIMAEKAELMRNRELFKRDLERFNEWKVVANKWYSENIAGIFVKGPLLDPLAWGQDVTAEPTQERPISLED